MKTPVVYAKDAESLAGGIMAARDLDPGKTIAQVGLDDGQGHLKIMLSMKNREGEVPRNTKKVKYCEEYAVNEFKLSGAKRLIILLIAPTTSERHDNLVTYLSLLKIDLSKDVNNIVKKIRRF